MAHARGPGPPPSFAASPPARGGRPDRAVPPFPPGVASAAASYAGPLLPLRRVPGARRARQARSRLTRERLIAAVQVAVMELGLQGATVRAIAARAGVSVGTVYRRFPSKAALLACARERVLERQTRRTLLALRPPGGAAHPARPAGRRGLGRYVHRAFLEIERERPLLEAFAHESYPGDRVHAALVERLARRDRRSGTPGTSAGGSSGAAAAAVAAEILVLALRGLVPAGSRPPAAARSRWARVERWCDHFVRALDL